MKKQCIIKSAGAQTRVSNLIVSQINSAVSFFSEPPVARIESKTEFYTTIVVEEKHMMTFAVIDTIREVAEKFRAKYQGCFYIMSSRPYLASDGETWLHHPVFEINLKRYEK